MPKFFYIARNKAGNKESGVEEASNQEEAISRLQAQDLVVINIFSESKEAQVQPGAEVVPKAKFKAKHYGIKSDDLVLFCRQVATLLGAGVTILKTLNIISQQVASQRLRNVIQDLQKDMEAGLSFHEAMAKHPTVFSELWVNLVDSGESSGNLAVVLSRLAGYLERNSEFKKKIISALIYPLILMCAGLGALLFLTIKIIPTFAELFQGFNMTLPFLTRMLMGLSNFLKHYFFIIILGAVMGFFLLRNYISTKQGRKEYEKLLLKIPLLNDFFRALITERFTSEMSTLVESGVPILFSLEIAEHSVGSLVLGDIIRNIKDDVREGKSLSQPLERSGFFDPMTVQMITIGEEIGELSNMFKRLNTFYQEYVDTSLTRFVSMFEPIVIIFMGAIVGIIVVGMFLPIFKLSQIG